MDIIFTNFLAIPRANSGKRSITVRSKTDGLSEPSPVRDPAPGAGKWLKKAGAFQAPRLLLGVILRCQVAANVLAANGGEASKFTLTAECNRAEHLLMNESTAH